MLGGVRGSGPSLVAAYEDRVRRCVATAVCGSVSQGNRKIRHSSALVQRGKIRVWARFFAGVYD